MFSGALCSLRILRIGRIGSAFILAVVLLLPPAPCPGDAVKAKVLSLGFQKRIQVEISS